MTGEIYYRYDDSYYGEAAPRLSEFWVVRRTPKGAWVAPRWVAPDDIKTVSFDVLRRAYGVRHVLDGKGRRYAYPDLADAKESYRIRKVRQIQHCRSSIEKAEKALAWCEGRLDELAATPTHIQFA